MTIPISTSKPVQQVAQTITTPVTTPSVENNTENLLNLGINIKVSWY